MSTTPQNNDPRNDKEPHQSKHNKGRFSIDLSLELERQLDNDYEDDLPSTPLPDQLLTPSTAPSSSSAYTQESASASAGSSASRETQGLDPQILASIVLQLRQNLADITTERDGLLEMLAKSNASEANLQDALQHLTDKSSTMEEELQEARRKQRDDEEAISMLRTKVEESRRGLMRLQTETRRMSTAPMAIDMNRVAAFSGATSKAAKRASFTPLTGSFNYSAPPMGRGHRRISSISDSGTPSHSSLTPGDIFDGRSPGPSPNGQILFADSASTHPPTSRRFSGFFGKSSSPPNAANAELYSAYDPVAAELEALRRELQGVKDELDEAKIELSESVEAKEASETCVQALREFIAENNVGASVQQPIQQQHRPPSLFSRHSELDSPAVADPLESSKKGWGFKLWKIESAANSPVITAPTPTSAHPATPAPLVTTGTNIARKMGGFFSGRSASVSSTTSLVPQPQQSQTTSPAPSISLSLDEEDSLEEPVSPADVVVGPVPMVRDSVSSASSSINGGLKNFSALASDKKEQTAVPAVHEVTV